MVEYHHIHLSSSYLGGGISPIINAELSGRAKKGWRVRSIEYDLSSKEYVSVYILFVRNARLRNLE